MICEHKISFALISIYGETMAQDTASYLFQEVQSYPYLNDAICYHSFDLMDQTLLNVDSIVSPHSDLLLEMYIALIVKVSRLSKNGALAHYHIGKGKNSAIRESDLKFLQYGIRFVNKFVKGKEYSVANLKLNRGILKTVYEELSGLLSRYTFLSDKVSALRQSLSPSTMERLSLCEKEMTSIQEMTKLSEETIYGLYPQINYTLQQYARLFNKIYHSYLRVVYKEAVRIVKSRQDALPDAFQNGTAGLSKAIEYFDTSKGYSFQTYASPWIRKAILEQSEKEASLLPISSSVWRKFNQFQKVRNKNHTSKPDIAFIAEEMDRKEGEIEGVFRTVENRRVLLLDAPLGEEGKDTLMDTVHQTTFSVEKEEKSNVLGDFQKEHQKVIGLLFGVLPENDQSKISSQDVRDEKVRQLLSQKEEPDA